MDTGAAPDWEEPNRTPCVDERTGGDRRKSERRAPTPRFHPLFLATLVNHVAPREARQAPALAFAPKAPRVGMLVNRRV